MNWPTYVVMRTSPAVMARPCDARGCGETIHTGEPLALVVHEARWLFDPEARDGQAFLCESCTRTMGANARPADLTQRTVPEPFLYRGKPVEAW